MSREQKHALELLERARGDDPTTSDGLVYGGKTFYDGEVKVAYVNFQTYRALVRRGLVRSGEWDPEWGTEIVLAGPDTPEDA